MAEGNVSQATHLTELDFDISKIPNQMEELSKLTEKYAKEIGENFRNQKIDFNFSIEKDSIGNDATSSVKRVADNVKKQIEESFKDLTGDQSIVSEIFSKEDIDEAKERLLSLISVYGRISKIKIDTDSNSEALKASVTSIDDMGRQLVETFQLQRKEIKNSIGEVTEYSNEWSKVGSVITENLEKQRQLQEKAEKERLAALEREEKLLQSNLKYIDLQIERQKDLTTKYSLKIGDDSEFTKQSKILQGQLEIIRDHASDTKQLTETEEKRVEQLAKQSREIERQYKVELEFQKEFAKALKEEELARVEAEKAKEKARKEFEKALQAEIKAQKQAQQEYEKSQKAEAKAEEQREKQLKKNLDYLDKQIERQKDLSSKYAYKSGDTSEITKQSKALREQLEIIRKQVAENKEFTESEKKQTEEIIKQSRELERQYKYTTSDKKNSFLSSVDMLKLTAIQKGTMLAEEAFEETFRTLKSIEDQIVNITRVFSDANLDMQQFSQSMFDLSTSYGRSFEDASEVVLRFAQAGEDASDSLKLAESTLLALNTAELDVENSTNSLIGIMQQWKLENEDFPFLIDKINYAADNYAVTSQDLVDGLLRSSSTAKNANIAFDETIGLLVAMREASGRTGKEVGVALNSLITFTQKAQTDGTLEGMGINVYADAAKTSLKGVLDIWEELSEKVKSGGSEMVDSLMSQAEAAGLMSEEIANYAGLTEELAQIQELESQATQQNISDLEKQEIYELAKTYRRNYFIALLENFNKVQEVANDLQNAEGHSMQENAKYMETLTAKYEQFKVSLQELAYQAGEAGLMDLAKDVLTLATNFNEFLKSVGGAETALKILLGIIIQLKAAKIAEWSNDLYKSLLNVATSFKGFTGAMKTAYKSGGDFGVLMTGLTNIPIASWLAAGTIAYGAITAAIQKANAEAENQRQETIKVAQAEYDKVKSLRETKKEYDSLSQVQEKTKEQEDELLELSQKMKKELGDRAMALKDLEEGTVAYNRELERQIKLSEDAAKTQLTDALRSAKESLESSIKSDAFGGIAGALGATDIGISLPTQDIYEANGALTKTGEIISKIIGNFSDLQSRWGDDGVGKFFAPKDDSAESIMEYYDALKKTKQALDEYGGSLTESERSALTSSGAYRQVSEELSKLDEEGKVAAVVQAEVNKAFLDLKDSVPESASGFDAFVDKVMETTGLSDTFRDIVEKMAKDTFPVFANAINDATGEVDEIQEAMNRAAAAAQDLEEASQSLDEIQGAYDTLANAVSEYNATGELSIDTLQSLLSLHPQYLATLKNESGQLSINSQMFEQLAAAELYEMQTAAMRQVIDIVSTFQSESEAIAFLTGNLDAASAAENQFAQESSKMVAALITQKGWTDEAKNALLDYANTISTAIGSVQNSLKTTFNTIPKYTASTSSARTAATKSFYETETEAFERLNRMGQKTTQEVVDFYRQMTKSSKVSASERLKAEEKLFDAIKKQIQEALEYQIDALNKQKDLIEEAADAEIDKLNDRKEAIEDSYNSRKEQLEAEKEAIEDRYDAELDALDKVEKERDRAREREEYLKNRSDILDDLASAQRRSGIDARRAEQEAKEKLEELDKEYQQKLEDYDLEDQREAIEAAKEAQLEAIEEQMDALEEWRESSIESIEESIEKVEEQKERELEAIDEKIAMLNEKFSESQINMLAYQAMTNEELYNQYLAQFIEPMANGMYDGFVQANDMMVEAASVSAQNMYAVYQNELINPLTEALSSIGSALDGYSMEIQNVAEQLPYHNGGAGFDQYFPESGHGASPGGWGAQNLSITNNNTINNWADANRLSRKVVGDITDAFRAK